MRFPLLFFDVRMTRLWDGTQISRIHHHTVGITMRYRVSAVFCCCIGAVELRDGLRQERASITDFHGLINQRVHIVLEQRAASAKPNSTGAVSRLLPESLALEALPLPESPVSLDLAESFVPEPALLDESDLSPPPMAEVRPPHSHHIASSTWTWCHRQ